ncbi:hypothetical protein BJ508DRAFT_118364 [Ascobolus immersus RN42]|uniref:Uncharacterized protein n=1 Tax=Ascobolus immersus RN42 TaxID=1160509 RepID=A0A3N4IA59_ASCIM|nr:hypothetical protein BJ508DRAFT_118364 [Ascobolus immersus RN42]
MPSCAGTFPFHSPPSLTFLTFPFKPPQTTPPTASTTTNIAHTTTMVDPTRPPKPRSILKLPPTTTFPAKLHHHLITTYRGRPEKWDSLIHILRETLGDGFVEKIAGKLPYLRETRENAVLRELKGMVERGEIPLTEAQLARLEPSPIRLNNIPLVPTPLLTQDLLETSIRNAAVTNPAVLTHPEGAAGTLTNAQLGSVVGSLEEVGNVTLGTLISMLVSEHTSTKEEKDERVVGDSQGTEGGWVPESGGLELGSDDTACGSGVEVGSNKRVSFGSVMTVEDSFGVDTVEMEFEREERENGGGKRRRVLVDSDDE